MTKLLPAATLYYDGRCPLCLREMDKLATLKSDELQLVDIHGLVAEPGMPDRDTLLRDLHMRLPDGRWLTGVDANVRAWTYAGRGVWLSWLRWPVIRQLADVGYALWAGWRYRRLYGSGNEGANCNN